MMQRHSVLRRWLISYLVILVVPLLLSIGIYFLSQRIIFRTSEEIYITTKTRQIQFFTLGGFLFYSVFGVFFAVRMTHRNYGEYHSLELALEDNQRILRKYYLCTLLEKPFDPVKDGEGIKLYGIQLSGDNFLVILFNTGESRHEEACFFFLKAFQEAADRHILTEMTDAGLNIAAIVNWPGSLEDSEIVIDQLEDDIEEAQQKTKDRFGLLVSAALSNPHRGIEGIYNANLEAGEAFQYLAGSQNKPILRYQNILYFDDSYQYPLEIEQKIINFIHLGDHEKAEGLLRQVFADNVSRIGFSAQTVKLLAADLMGTLMKGRLSPETKFPVIPPPPPQRRYSSRKPDRLHREGPGGNLPGKPFISGSKTLPPTRGAGKSLRQRKFQKSRSEYLYYCIAF
jgi:hypothetical protein